MNAACGLVVPLWTGTSWGRIPGGGGRPLQRRAGSPPVGRQACGTTLERRGAGRIDGRPGSYSRCGPSGRRIRFDQEEPWGGYRHGKWAVHPTDHPADHPAGSCRGRPSPSDIVS
jgi:hypothetical protein